MLNLNSKIRYVDDPVKKQIYEALKRNDINKNFERLRKCWFGHCGEGNTDLQFEDEKVSRISASTLFGRFRKCTDLPYN